MISIGEQKNGTSRISAALRAVSWDADAISVSSRDVTVRSVRNEWEMDEVYRMTHDAYVERGYTVPRPDGRLIHYPHLDGIPETTVLVAEVEGELVGTNSFTFDNSFGLPDDVDFRRECDAIRQEGRKLAASWRLVTRSGYRDERQIVMGLIQESIRRIVETGVTTCLFTFNPRHERVYQRLLNMKTVARSGETSGLQNAPAVFMRCDFETLPAWCLKEVAVAVPAWR
ncbi:MAG: hypothetical protein V1809_03790 [Planctomycetota bacterium]